MTRYTTILILLLSFLIPLQVAAEVLVSAALCPENMAMEMDEVEGSEFMPCCPDKSCSHKKEETKANLCKTVNTCHLCKTPGQVYLSVPTVISSLLNHSFFPKLTVTHIATLNPASIWRPPTIS